jgi:hypothetical protein
MRDGEEKRREPRVKVEGSVDLYWEEGDAPVALRGELVDVSRNGFRASHEGSGLMKGQRVSFRHAQAGGRAVVVWNRIAGGVTETGFLVV